MIIPKTFSSPQEPVFIPLAGDSAVLVEDAWFGWELSTLQFYPPGDFRECLKKVAIFTSRWQGLGGVGGSRTLSTQRSPVLLDTGPMTQTYVGPDVSSVWAEKPSSQGIR